METTVQDVRGDGAVANRPGRSINVGESERKLSTAFGAALIGLGMASGFRLRSLVLAGLGAAVVYRGVTGHCHFYEAMGIDTSPTDEESAADEESAPSEAPIQRQSTAHRESVKNRVDKDRFDKLKATQVDRGRDKDKAIEVAAEEVKELRRREGRSKKDEDANFEKFDES